MKKLVVLKDSNRIVYGDTNEDGTEISGKADDMTVDALTAVATYLYNGGDKYKERDPTQEGIFGVKIEGKVLCLLPGELWDEMTKKE